MNGSLFDDRDAFSAELRKRCGSAQVFRAVWALVDPVFEAAQQAKRTAPIIEAAIAQGLVTRAEADGEDDYYRHRPYGG